MKTWQMIKELAESPNKKFRVKGTNDIVYMLHDILYWNEDNVVFTLSNGTTLHHEWEEVKEPVDFMTAIESLNEDNRICCEVSGKKYTYYKPSTPTYEIKSIEAGGISIAEILYGKWYIEDQIK